MTTHISNSLTQYIRVYKDALTLDECASFISFFDSSDEKYKGPVERPEGIVIDEDVKVVEQVNVPFESDIDNVLVGSVSTLIKKYIEEFKFYPSQALTDDGYHIKRYEPNVGHYDWHTDNCTPAISHRVAVILWYLNDVKEGGESEFGWGKKIKPKAGSALMFPASWLYPHKGHKPISNAKYVASTWIGYKRN